MQEYDVITRIKELCQARSWTYYRLAKESGITYSTLSTMMNKTTSPSIQTLAKICCGFGITIAEFFSDDCDFAKLTDEEKQHLELWNELTPENKQNLELYIHFLISTQRSQQKNP